MWSVFRAYSKRIQKLTGRTEAGESFLRFVKNAINLSDWQKQELNNTNHFPGREIPLIFLKRETA